MQFFKNNLTVTCTSLFFCFSLAASADSAQFETGRNAISNMGGCYLVDYNYMETEALKPGYVRDARIYDVNKNQSIKEWIYTEEISANRLRVQHILFGVDLSGNFMTGSMLKHQAEDWEYQAPFIYEFTSPNHWKVVFSGDDSNTWTRRITNLDDGLRYQCSAAWSVANAYPQWKCDNFSPIPGRETRDMARKDYNTLSRSTNIISYKNSWLERQNNTKTIYANETVTPLAKETGKNWYVRIADSDCADAQIFVAQRKEFWTLLREVWDEVLVGNANFVEKQPANQPPRYVKLKQIEDSMYDKNLSDLSVRASAKEQILAIIKEYQE